VQAQQGLPIGCFTWEEEERSNGDSVCINKLLFQPGIVRGARLAPFIYSSSKNYLMPPEDNQHHFLMFCHFLIPPLRRPSFQSHDPNHMHSL
jgi:hypothetical protein